MFDLLPGQLRAKEVDMGVGIEEGSKEGKANKVIAMTMSDEEREVEPAAVGLLHQLLAEPNNAASCIKNQRMRSGQDFDTGRIPSMPESVLARRGVASSHSPEAYQKTLLISHTYHLAPTAHA